MRVYVFICACQIFCLNIGYLVCAGDCSYQPEALYLEGEYSDGSSQFTSESSKEFSINSHLIGLRLGLELESLKSSPLKSLKRF